MNYKYLKTFNELNEKKSYMKSFDYEAIKYNTKGKPILYVTSYKIITDDGEKVTCNVNGYEYTDIKIDEKIKKGWIEVENKTFTLVKKDFNTGTVKRKIYKI